MDSYLQELERKSIAIIREAKAQFKNPAVLWSTGKDSTATVWLCKKAFFGKVPFPVIHIDTSYKFQEIYEFRDRIAKEWNLNLIIAKNEKALKEGMSPEKGRLKCCTALKTEALKNLIKERKFDALILAIRRDEHGIRAKERYYSPRDENFHWNYKDQPAELWDLYVKPSEDFSHMRVHPILHWTELDVWCVPPETLVTTEKGVERIKDTIDTETLFVLSEDGFVPIVNKYTTFTDTLVEIETETGRKISVTKDNLVFTSRGWLPPTLINENDYLLVQSNEKVERVNGQDKKTSKFQKVLEQRRRGNLEKMVAGGENLNVEKNASKTECKSDVMESQEIRDTEVGRNSVSAPLYSYQAYRNRSSIHRRYNRWRRHNFLNKGQKDGFNSFLPERNQYVPSSLGISSEQTSSPLLLPENESTKPFWHEENWRSHDKQYLENPRYYPADSSVSYYKKEAGRVSLGVCKRQNWKRMLRTLNRKANKNLFSNQRVKFIFERTTRVNWKHRCQKVYDLTTISHSFFANNVLIHNTYVKQEGLPVNPLYFAKNGKRYRSLGCKPCTVPIPSNAKTIDEIIEEIKTSKTPERAGRAQDKEKAYMMQKLRSLGYM